MVKSLHPQHFSSYQRSRPDCVRAAEDSRWVAGNLFGSFQRRARGTVGRNLRAMRVFGMLCGAYLALSNRPTLGLLARRLFTELARERGQLRAFLQSVEETLRYPRKTNLRSDQCAGENAAGLV